MPTFDENADGAEFLRRFDINKDGVLDKVEMRLMLEQGGGAAALVRMAIDDMHLDPETNQVTQKARASAAVQVHPHAHEYDTLERLPMRYLFYVGPMALALRFPGAHMTTYPSVIPHLEGLGNVFAGWCWTTSCALVAAHVGYSAMRGAVGTPPCPTHDCSLAAPVPLSNLMSVRQALVFHGIASLVGPTFTIMGCQRVAVRLLPQYAQSRGLPGACSLVALTFPFALDPFAWLVTRTFS